MNTSRGAELTGWTPRVTIDEGFAQTIAIRVLRTQVHHLAVAKETRHHGDAGGIQLQAVQIEHGPSPDRKPLAIDRVGLPVGVPVQVRVSPISSDAVRVTVVVRLKMNPGSRTAPVLLRKAA